MKIFFALASLGLSAAAAQAGTLLSFNFETNNFAYFYGYTYQETGATSFANNGGTPTAGGGRNGTAGAVTTFNTTGASGGYAGFGTGFGANPTNKTDISGAGSLGDFSFAIDLRADGMTAASAPAILELKFEVPDNFLLPADAGTEADTLLVLKYNRTLTSAYQTFTSTLADWTVNSGSLALLKSNIGALNNINFNVAYEGTGALPAFGNDANNVFAADNYSLSVVPEVGSASLCLLTLGALAARRRR